MKDDTARASAQPAGPTDSGAPFGTQPRRAPGPLIVWGALYAFWLLVLIWMALFQVR